MWTFSRSVTTSEALEGKYPKLNLENFHVGNSYGLVYVLYVTLSLCRLMVVIQIHSNSTESNKVADERYDICAIFAV